MNFSDIKRGFAAFRRSTSKELLIFIVVFGGIFAVIALNFVSDMYNGWKVTKPSSSDNLRLAKEICEVRRDGTVFCVARPEAAIELLKQIPAGASEYGEAVHLLPILEAQATKQSEENEAERKIMVAKEEAAKAQRLRLANQTESESLAQMLKNEGGEAHDPFICGKDANNRPTVSFDNGHYWWVDDGRCAKQEEKFQQAIAQVELQKRQREQAKRDLDAQMSSYWPTTLRVDTDMDSFWLNKEERVCQTYPDEKGVVTTVACNASGSHREHNIPVKFWGGVERNTVSNWKCRREEDQFVCRAID